MHEVHALGSATGAIIGQPAANLGDLKLLGGRQPGPVDAILDAGPPLSRLRKDRPGRGPRPAGHARQEGRGRRRPSARVEQVGEGEGRVALEEQRISALARQQGGDAGVAAGLGDGDVIEHIPSVLAGSRRAGGRLQQGGGQRPLRPPTTGQPDPRALRNRARVEQLIGFGAAGQSVERQTRTAARGDNAPDHNRRIQSSRDLGAQTVAAVRKGLDRLVERLPQGGGVVGGRPGRQTGEGLRAPQPMTHAAVEIAPFARRKRLQTGEGEGVQAARGLGELTGDL